MKHLKSAWKWLCFHTSRIQIAFYKTFFPEKALLIKREGERTLLIDQLTRNIEVNTGYRKVSGRREGNFAKQTQKIELQKRFLQEIKNRPIEQFEEIATKWMKRMKGV